MAFEEKGEILSDDDPKFNSAKIGKKKKKSYQLLIIQNFR